MITTGIFARTFTGTLDEICRQVRENGFSRIQFNYACAGLSSLPQYIDPTELNAVRECLDRHELTVDAISGTFNMIHPDPVQRRQGLNALRTIAKTCALLNTKLITLCTGSRNPVDMWTAHPDNDRPDAWKELRDTLDQALEIAAEYGLFLGVEPETANVINSVEKAARLLNEVNSPHLKIVFDPANLFDHDPDHVIYDRISKGLDLLGESIISAHAKDRSAEGHVVPAGTGTVPFPDYIAGLIHAGYTGGLIIHGLAPQDVPATKHYLDDLLSGSENGL